MNVLRFFLHLVISTFGVIILAALSVFSITEALHPIFPTIGSPTASWILTQTPYFPVQILTGFLMGFKIARRYQDRVMLLVWIAPALVIAYVIGSVPLRPVMVSGVEISPMQHFFGWNCLPQNHCYEQVGATVFLYSSLAYSLGARLGFRRQYAALAS